MSDPDKEQLALELIDRMPYISCLKDLFSKWSALPCDVRNRVQERLNVQGTGLFEIIKLALLRWSEKGAPGDIPSAYSFFGTRRLFYKRADLVAAIELIKGQISAVLRDMGYVEDTEELSSIDLNSLPKGPLLENFDDETIIKITPLGSYVEESDPNPLSDLDQPSTSGTAKQDEPSTSGSGSNVPEDVPKDSDNSSSK